jgi:23S rRNA (adenine2030-N6)-methyltransferase
VEAKDSPVGLLGSGLVMINPPYQLDKLLIEQLPLLAKILSRGQDFESDCRWLVPE